MAVSQVADNIYQIGPLARVFDDVMAYVVVDDRAALIEAGPTSTIPSILEALAQIGISSSSLAYIIPTHIHIDHAGGAGGLARELPGARVVAHERGARHLKDPARLIAATRQVFGNFEDQLGPILPVAGEQLHVSQDGEILSLGKRELQIIYAPGHAPHHLAILDTRTRGLFCGEALGCHPLPEGDFVVPGVAPPDFDLDLYLETIGKLEKLEPSILFYSHNGVSREASKLIGLVRESVLAYSDIILAAVKAGEGPDQITKRLEAHIASVISAPVELTCPRPVQGYMAYFRRKNLIPERS